MPVFWHLVMDGTLGKFGELSRRVLCKLLEAHSYASLVLINLLACNITPHLFAKELNQFLLLLIHVLIYQLTGQRLFSHGLSSCLDLLKTLYYLKPITCT